MIHFLLWSLSLWTLVSSACLSAQELADLGITPLQRHPIHDRIVIERDWWNGHYITTEIGRILLEDAMGFPVEISDYSGSTSFDEMTAEKTDINLEVWVSSQVGSIFQENIINAGPTGIIGRVGLYFPSYMMENHSSSYLELWRSYAREPEVTSLFPRAGTFAVDVPGREFVPPQCLLNVTPAGCDIYGADYDGFLCNVTDIDPNCMTIWSFDFTFDGAWIHQLIRNLGLNWTVSHMFDIEPSMAEAMGNQAPFIVYSWSPNEDTSLYGLQRVTFPEISPACVANVGTEQDGVGSVNCDFEIQVILKIMSERMESTESLSQAAKFVRSFTLTTPQQELILAQMGNLDPNPIWGADPTSTIGIELACSWVKNNTGIWRDWIVNIPPAPPLYLTFWSNASITALFYTCFVWPIGAWLCIYRRNVHPLALVPNNDLILGFLCPLFALFIPIGIQTTWRSVGCYSSLWMLALVTPISFIAPLFVSHSVVIEVFLQDLRSAVVLKRMTNEVATRRLAILRVLKSLWCQVLFSLLILLVSVFVIVGVNHGTGITNTDEVCALDRSWRTTMLIELILYVLLVMILAPTLLKAAHRRAFFVTIFPISFLLMAVAVSAMYQTDVMRTDENPFSFNAVFSLHWLIAVLVFMVVVLNPALRSLGSCKLNKNTKITEGDVELSLSMLLDSAVGFRHFLAFAREQFCEENVLALRAVHRFASNPSLEEMDKIYDKCINRSSLFAINISSDCFAKCERAYQNARQSTTTPDNEVLKLVFADVEKELRRLIEQNLVGQFQVSSHFDNFMAELEDREDSGTLSLGFRRLKSKLIDNKRSGVELSGSKHGGSKHGEENHSRDGGKPASAAPSTPEPQVDFLGLPTSFTSRSSKQHGKDKDQSRDGGGEASRTSKVSAADDDLKSPV